jgi:hypothetical protein
MNTSRPGAYPQQRALALEPANNVRLARAVLNRRLRAGKVAAAKAIRRTSRDTDTMTVAELLLSQRGWAEAFLEDACSVSPSEKRRSGP